jgi:hypothetical protein
MEKSGNIVASQGVLGLLSKGKVRYFLLGVTFGKAFQKAGNCSILLLFFQTHFFSALNKLTLLIQYIWPVQ